MMNLKPKLLILGLVLFAVPSQSTNNTTKSNVNSLTGHDAVVQSVAYSPDGKLLATGDWNGLINIYKIDSTIEYSQTLYGHEAVVTCLEFSRDSKKLISGGNDFTVITWEFTGDWTGFEAKKIAKPHKQPISGVAYGPGLKTTFSASADGKVIINNLQTNKEKVIDHKAPINGMVISSNRQFIYVADQSTVIQEYDMLGNAKRKFEGHEGEVLSIAYSTNRQFILSGSSDENAIVWDVLKGKKKHVLSKHTWKVNSVDISSDSKYGVTGGKDGNCYLWDLNTGNLLDSFHVNGDINDVEFNHDNQYVAIGARLKGEDITDQGAIIWKTGLPSRFAKPKPQQMPAKAPAKTPGGKDKPQKVPTAPSEKASGILPEKQMIR